ncbi:MAG: cation-transporting P-type ATPase, partial [Actinomycetota bacterium]
RGRRGYGGAEVQQLERHDPEGLSEAAAAARLLRDGPNVLPVRRPRPLWREVAGQLTHFFALMLWVAGVLAFVAGLPQLGVAIFVVVLANGAFAFAQEHRAQRAAERLRDLLPKRATVIRDGRRLEVDAAELVIDDLVLLEAGGRISADLRIERAAAAMVGTAALTGESVPTSVDTGGEVFAGTFLLEGEAAGVVTATGTDTRLAGIAALAAASHRPRSPLSLELRRVVRTISTIALLVGASFFGVALLVGIAPNEGFLFAIGVVVALVPEGLLPTVTLSLAIGAQRMARRDALVRRLDAVETLGSATFICTDKTGTLTWNEMSAVEVWMPGGSARIHGRGYEPTATVEADPAIDEDAVRRLAMVAARCSTGHADLRDGVWTAVGDPMDAAIDALARRVGADVSADRTASPELARFPFDPRRRRVSSASADHVYVKGAPEAVMPVCRGEPDAPRALDALTAQGLRVIAVATREAHEPPREAVDAERDLELVGFIGLLDPPRGDVEESIASCRRAGVRIAMVTGDHPATAVSIARAVGLAPENGPVLIGDDLPEDEQVLAAAIDRDGIVLARVSPEQKVRIARALRSRGHVVAMTGDGVNDGPALQEADIGVAMGRSGTDVAREASDLVLLDDHFGTIVTAIEHGRVTFNNVQKFLTYHLTDNVAELTPFAVWALSGGRIPLALSVMQILVLDLATDTFSAVALGAEPPVAGALTSTTPVRGRLLDRVVAIRAFAVAGPTEAVFEMGAFFASLFAFGWRPGAPFPSGMALAAASGAAFVVVVLAQTANAFACRSSTLPAWRIGWLTNRMLVLGASIELVLAAAFLFWPVLAAPLDHRPPPVIGWAIAVGSMPALLLIDASFKRIFRRRLASTGAAVAA